MDNTVSYGSDFAFENFKIALLFISGVALGSLVILFCIAFPILCVDNEITPKVDPQEDNVDKADKN